MMGSPLYSVVSQVRQRVDEGLKTSIPSERPPFLVIYVEGCARRRDRAENKSQQRSPRRHAHSARRLGTRLGEHVSA